MTFTEAIRELKEDRALYESDFCYAGDGTGDGNLMQALDMAIEALEKLNQIIEVLDDTDFNNAVSLNDIGEDKGYCEAICEISIIADDKERWY